MGYRIDYRMRDGTLCAVVRGKSSFAHAAWIAHDIAEQASREAVSRLIIDLRGLADRVGTLGVLLMARSGPRVSSSCRIAVLDVEENDPYYSFVELAAQGAGYVLRYFADAAAAVNWLGERQGEDGAVASGRQPRRGTA